MRVINNRLDMVEITVKIENVFDINEISKTSKFIDDLGAV